MDEVLYFIGFALIVPVIYFASKGFMSYFFTSEINHIEKSELVSTEKGLNNVDIVKSVSVEKKNGNITAIDLKEMKVETESLISKYRERLDKNRGSVSSDEIQEKSVGSDNNLEKPKYDDAF